MLLKISYFWPFFANFLVLDRKLIWMALFWAVTLNFWVAPSWLKTYFESIFSLFFNLTCLDWFSELRILCIYIFLEMSFALASPFYCLPIFGDRLLYQTSGKFQSRLLEASFLVVNWNTFVWFQALVFDLRNFLCWYHIFGTSQIWSGCDVLT